MTVYAFRETPHSRMLVEFDSQKQIDRMNASNAPRDGGHDYQVFYRRIDAATAHQWVRKGNIHETLLWIDQGKVRRA